MQRLFFIFLCLVVVSPLSAQYLDSLEAFDTPVARQAVAVDGEYLYAIDNITIEKYDKSTGKTVKTWKDTSGTLKHLNSGVILNGKLYCAHSNFPEAPMTSSIEVFDPEELTPIESHSLGIDIGSATWIDWYDGHWYIAFAHYSNTGKELDKDNRWTQLVKFNNDWQRIGGWVLPKELIERFGTMSNSGGFITSEGHIYLTGHDDKELYQMEFPSMGSALKWVNTLPAPFEGQGVSVDPTNGQVVYGISRSQKKIVKARFEGGTD